VSVVSSIQLEVTAHLDPDDVVRGLDNDDEKVLAFVTAMLRASGSAALRGRLSACLADWPEEGS